MLSIPSDKGTYALYLRLTGSKTITIGKLGRFNFPRGAYIYIGSALGFGGLRSRLERHLYGSTRNHWHIDYLRKDAEVQGFLYLINNRNYECQWVQALIELSGAYIPAPGFGSSDCHKCRAHLIAFPYSDISRELTLKHEIQLATIKDTFTEITTLPPQEIKCSHFQI
jgi:Uri superfamily endonuclease